VTPIRVVVVDDHMVFREGLRALLGRVDDIEIVGEAATTQEAIDVTEGVRPDVVLMDLNLPGNGGEVATTTILAAHPEMAVLVLTMHSDDGHLRHALNAGARGYLLKDAEPDAIIRAIVAVHEGQAIFDPGIAPRVIAATGASQASALSPSSPSGSTRSWTGSPAGYATTRSLPGWASASRRCRTNVSTILLKLGATDRAQAVALARDAGMGRRP
jgi:DNA-binding NarL/FixJ family response regulator